MYIRCSISLALNPLRNYSTRTSIQLDFWIQISSTLLLARLPESICVFVSAESNANRYASINLTLLERKVLTGEKFEKDVVPYCTTFSLFR